MNSLNDYTKALVLNKAGFFLRALGRLAEAAQPMQAALEARISQENWTNAARNASNLSELTLTLGDLAAAVASAEQSVELADRSGDAFQRMSKRTTLADALHHEGRLDEAAVVFEEAEAMQKERQPAYPRLYSLQGYRYCDLLLSRGEYEAVLTRAAQTIKIAERNNWLLNIALDHLALGRAHLLAAQASGGTDFSRAAHHLDQAVDGLRQAGTQHMLPLGLLARAALFRLQGNFERAQRDLDEARLITGRGGMRLFVADVHLESARLALARGEKRAKEQGSGGAAGEDLLAQARQHLATAKAMIEAMGYHRRDPEVKELEEGMRDEG